VELKRAIGLTAAMILIILGVLFSIASIEHAPRLLVGIVLVGCGFGIIYFLKRSEKMTVIVPTIPGRVSVQSLKCPNCAAQLDTNKMELKGGVPTIECPYCGASLELTEEPKW
jgi:Zn ribbon nucleic-acid-binding protein